MPKHGMTIDDIESVFSSSITILPDKPNLQGEIRYRAIGETAKGRKAFIIFTLRERAHKKLLRPISARFMHKDEVEHYEKTYSNI